MLKQKGLGKVIFRKRGPGMISGIPILPENIRAQKLACKLTFKHSKTVILRRYGQKWLAQQWVLAKNILTKILFKCIS